MRDVDIRALGALLGEASDATGGLVEDTHAAIAKRTFDAIGPASAPVRHVHDRISALVYRTVRGGLRAASRHGAELFAQRADPRAEPLSELPVGGLAVGALNGLWGDLLEERGNPLALPMTVRSGGHDVALTRDAVAAAFPEATTRLAVFLHGLCETDAAWRGLPERDVQPFGDRLRDDLDLTPVSIRFNSGRRISANGAELSALLQHLVDAWPVPVDEIALVGHSMGGLVARSACHAGERSKHSWTDAVRHVFCLGSPHLGADLERGVHLLDWALAQFPETRGFSGLLRRRSVGVKDLRFGAVVEADWDGHDPDEFLRDRCGEVPFLPDAHYYFVGARLTDGPLGLALGDLLVRMPSASGVGRARSIPFEVDHGVTLTGLTHFDLLTHPSVYAQLRGWIERAGFVARAG